MKKLLALVMLRRSPVLDRQSRRIQIARTATDGSFAYANLPPGNYLVAAVTDAEDGQWLDRSWLAELVSHAVKVIIPDDGKVVQNLQVRTP